MKAVAFTMNHLRAACCSAKTNRALSLLAVLKMGEIKGSLCYLILLEAQHPPGCAPLRCPCGIVRPHSIAVPEMQVGELGTGVALQGWLCSVQWQCCLSAGTAPCPWVAVRQ